MFVKQISVFLENKAGSLSNFAKLLGDNGFDLMSLSIADTMDFGIVRVIVPDYIRAQNLLIEAGYSVKITDVLSVSVPDKPGALAGVLEILSHHQIGLEYLYSFFRSHGGRALIIIRVDKPEEAEKALADADIKMLSQEDLQTV